MIQAKICMLGATSVGKTSLVASFVRSLFSEKYLTSIGVKIDSKRLRVCDTELMLMLWDLQGDDEFQRLRASYLRGALGLFFVADGTRRETLLTVCRLNQEFSPSPTVPRILAVNKADLQAEWEIEETDLLPLVRDGWTILRTSAKTAEGVESAFQALGQMIVAGRTGGRI